MSNGDHDFTAGEILTAANVDDYLMLQSMQKFATSTARDTALTTRKREGSCSIQDDANSITIYSGAAWSTIGPVHGIWTAYTPSITQSVNVTLTVNNSSYMRVGRMIHYRFTLSVTGAGTAANLVTLSMPVNINYVSDHGSLGYFQIHDISATTTYFGAAVPAGAGAIKGMANTNGGVAAPTFFGTTTFTAALASGDIVSGWVIFEAAADA